MLQHRMELSDQSPDIKHVNKTTNNTNNTNKDNYEDSLHLSVTFHDPQSWRICSFRIQTCLSLQDNVSIGLGKVRQAKGALKFPLSHSKFSLQVAGVGQWTQTISQEKTNTLQSLSPSLSLSLSLSDTLLTHLSLPWYTSLKSPNCDLPVNKQTILLWHTDTQNMLIRSCYYTSLLPTNCTSSNIQDWYCDMFRLLRVAILREYISQGKYRC